MKSPAAEQVDPGLKLFGRRIPVVESKMRAAPGEDSKQILRCQEHQVQNNVSEEEDTPSSQLDDLGSSSGSCEDEKVESEAKQPREVLNNVSNVVGAGKKGGKEQSPVATRTTVQQEQQRTGGQVHEQQQQQQCQQQQQTEKPVLKRPDKLVPCPRCNSMETKFCYFNNYNVNQPRHFCKNCQRYWTAGGTLRNVPVGAGRRKSKHNSGGGGGGGGGGVGHQEPLKNEQLKHQQTMNKVAARMRLPPILPQEICPFTPPETSPSGSMLTSLNSSPGSINSTIFNMHLAAAAAAAVASSQAPGEASVNVSPVGNPKNAWPDAPTRTTTTTGESAKECSLGQNRKTEIKEVASKECSGCGPTLFNGAPAPAWPFFPWHNFLTAGPQGNSDGPTAAGNKSSNDNVNNQGNNNSGDMASLLSSFWAAGMPAWAPFAAASLWGPSAAGASGWNLPWSAAAAAAAAAAFAAAATAPISSKNLGKHPRDKLECGRIDGCLWAPKTLRIDDPGEAAKSSLWATLGLDKAPAPPAGGGVRSPSGLCKSLHSKGGFEDKGGQSQKVHANPAALSRSMNFQENG